MMNIIFLEFLMSSFIHMSKVYRDHSNKGEKDTHKPYS